MTDARAIASLPAIARRFRNQSLATRAYIALRHRLLPADRIAALVPPGGRIVDLCCGYGTVSMLLALKDARRQVLGVDLDATRIAVAREVAGDIANVRFEAGDITTYGYDTVDAALILDSLHYFPPSTQLEILKSVRSRLSAGGTLVCREVIRSPSLRFFWNQLHERIMVGLSFTRSNEQTQYFDSLPVFEDRLRAAGFEVTLVEGPPLFHPYADHIIVARAA